MAKYKDYPDVVLARNLKKLCAEKNITQGQMGAICYKDRKAVNAWVNCVASPSAYSLKKICAYYGVSADELLGLRGEVNGKS